ncbi:hypothetical protein GCM10027403_00660 [Arthrobacter tecti]
MRQCAEGDLAVLTKHEPPGAGIAQRMLEHQHEGRVLFAAAWEAGAPVGTVILDFGATHPPELKNLFVNPSRRSAGIGSALCEWVEGEAKSAGFEDVYLGVGVENNRARNLYLRLGYVPTGDSASTTYGYVDEDGITRTATETSDYYVKKLG